MTSAQEAKPQGSIGIAGSGFEAFVFIAEAVDIKLLRQKFEKELEKDRKFIEGLKARLANGDFLKNAPPELVEGEKLKLEEGLRKTGKLESYIRDMA
jgi:valyl-tRNA synthetase